MVDDDWIKAIHDKQRAHHEAVTAAQAVERERRQFFADKIGGLWSSIVEELRSTVDRYNEYVPEERNKVAAEYDPVGHKFTAQKTVDPGGYLECAPKEDGSEISCRYRFVNSRTGDGGPARFPTQKTDEGLRIVGHATPADVARAILEPYFKAIG